MKYKHLHSWDVSPKKALEIQKKLIHKLNLKNTVRHLKYVAACDVSYSKVTNKVYAVVCVFTYPGLKLLESSHTTALCKFPYIPGLLSFRELPVLLKCFNKLKTNTHIILCDGQGIAHPRRMGIATHLGILLNRPAIGCAKSHLWGSYKPPARIKQSFSFIYDKKKQPIGVCLRTRTDTRPIYVSPGHKIDINTSVQIVLNCTKKFRIPEPLRYAHHLTQILRNADSYHR